MSLPDGRAREADLSHQARPHHESYVLKADMAAQRAADLDPRTADAYMALGSLQMLRMKFLSAGELFAKALTLDEDNPDTLNLYGMMPSGRRRGDVGIASLDVCTKLTFHYVSSQGDRS